jgi:hypothetical protein
MDAKRLAAAARIAVGVGIVTLAGGPAQVSAAPLDPPPPSPTSQPDPSPPKGVPAEKCWKYGRQGPGGPKGGGGVPVYPAPCPPAAPPPS